MGSGNENDAMLKPRTVLLEIEIDAMLKPRTIHTEIKIDAMMKPRTCRVQCTHPRIRVNVLSVSIE